MLTAHPRRRPSTPPPPLEFDTSSPPPPAPASAPGLEPYLSSSADAHANSPLQHQQSRLCYTPPKPVRATLDSDSEEEAGGLEEKGLEEKGLEDEGGLETKAAPAASSAPFGKGANAAHALPAPVAAQPEDVPSLDELVEARAQALLREERKTMAADAARDAAREAEEAETRRQDQQAAVERERAAHKQAALEQAQALDAARAQAEEQAALTLAQEQAEAQAEVQQRLDELEAREHELRAQREESAAEASARHEAAAAAEDLARERLAEVERREAAVEAQRRQLDGSASALQAATTTAEAETINASRLAAETLARAEESESASIARAREVEERWRETEQETARLDEIRLMTVADGEADMLRWKSERAEQERIIFERMSSLQGEVRWVGRGRGGYLWFIRVRGHPWMTHVLTNI